MNRLLAASAVTLALVSAAAAAHAGVTFISYGVSLPGGERLLTDFASRGGLVGGNLVTGSIPNFSAAPAFSPSTVDQAQYLSVPAGGSATLSFAKPTREVSVYVGSLDSWNSVSFGGPGAVSYTGAQLGAVSGQYDGDQSASHTNGRFIFTFASPVTSVVFSSSQPAFEIADVAAAIPEPAGWALMLVGLGVLGGALRGARPTGVLARR